MDHFKICVDGFLGELADTRARGTCQALSNCLEKVFSSSHEKRSPPGTLDRSPYAPGMSKINEMSNLGLKNNDPVGVLEILDSPESSHFRPKIHYGNCHSARKQQNQADLMSKACTNDNTVVCKHSNSEKEGMSKKRSGVHKDDIWGRNFTFFAISNRETRKSKRSKSCFIAFGFALAVAVLSFAADYRHSAEAFDYLPLLAEEMNVTSAIIRALRLAILTMAPSLVSLYNAVSPDDLRDSGGSPKCLISNPWYKDPLWDYHCSVCAEIHTFATPAQSVNKNLTVAPWALRTLQPVLFRGWGSSVSLWDVHREVEAHPVVTTDSETLLTPSSNTSFHIKAWSDLAKPDLILRLSMDKKAHCLWYSRGYVHSHVFNQLFPRPSFVPTDTDISTTKFLLLDGQEVAAYTLNLKGSSTTLYMQGQGSREVSFIPRPVCRDLCSTVSAALRPGDVCE
ncbi:hypothetical protein PoB_001322900 [Plakobranchus ocellatus]|uniref:Uncharacterized protein n=1 Tax=Plakobranchus ocellatus TaxID=259542 RepID=A0AAV3YYA7_9GAST|nr:hypothetical protein PoB_001322900 [Plakobranchus ocellatus]